MGETTVTLARKHLEELREVPASHADLDEIGNLPTAVPAELFSLGLVEPMAHQRGEAVRVGFHRTAAGDALAEPTE